MKAIAYIILASESAGNLASTFLARYLLHCSIKISEQTEMNVRLD
jgi:hypothetical protein